MELDKMKLGVELFTLRHAVVGYKRMVKNLSKLITRDVIEDGFSRVDGKVSCDGCGLPYEAHPEFGGPTFYLRCDGRIVKA